jgi:hypothetical protein
MRIASVNENRSLSDEGCACQKYRRFSSAAIIAQSFLLLQKEVI